MAETKVYRLENYFDYMPVDATSVQWHIEVMALTSNYFEAAVTGNADLAERSFYLLKEAHDRMHAAEWSEFHTALVATIASTGGGNTRG